MPQQINVLLIHDDRRFVFKRYCDVHVLVKKEEFLDRGLHVIDGGRMEIEAGLNWMEMQSMAHKDIGMVFDETGSLLAE